MAGHEAAGDTPDLAAEARFWREWNTAVFERNHSHEEAMKIAERLSPDPERLEALLARAKTSNALSRPPAAGTDAELVQIHAAAGRFYQSQLARSWAPGYLEQRGLGAVLLPSSPWKVGYAPDSWQALTRHLRELGYGDDALVRSGLVAEGRNGRLYDRFRNRLMIPVRRASDRVAVAFVGRRHPEATDDDGPKYLNSPNTDLYVKGHTLPGLAEGRWYLDHGAHPVLVEGLADAMAVSIAAPGKYVGVTTCGTALRPEQAVLLARQVDLDGSGLRIAFDPDGPGKKAAVRAYAPLTQVTSDVLAVSLPGMDPAEMLEKQGPQALKEVLEAKARPLAEHVADARIEAWCDDGRLDGVAQQFAAIRDVGKLIATMPPREAARQAGRIATMFIVEYGWHMEEATRELIEAIERHVPTPSAPESAGAREPPGRVPPQTAAILTNATAPRGSSPESAKRAQTLDEASPKPVTRVQHRQAQRD